MTDALTAERFNQRLEALASQAERDKYKRYFKFGDDEVFIGVRMGQVFDLAKEFIDLPTAELEKLLQSTVHESRAGACSVMGKSAAHKRSTDNRRAELYDLYLRRHDRVNNWDLVDLAARDVVGGYLRDRPRDILYQLARSPFWPERRTAIVACSYFIRAGDLADTFAIAERLLADEHDLVHKATGWMLRYAGSKDRRLLRDFLDTHSAAMPRTMLRAAIEHLDPEQRRHYLGLIKTAAGG